MKAEEIKAILEKYEWYTVADQSYRISDSSYEDLSIELSEKFQSKLQEKEKEIERLRGKVKDSWFASARNEKRNRSIALKGSTLNTITFNQWAEQNNVEVSPSEHIGTPKQS